MDAAIKKNCKEKMEKTLEHLKREFSKIRGGRATAAILDDIKVEHYGGHMTIPQLASINVPEPRQITIQPWDTSAIKAIESAILKSNIGLTPSNDGKLIRLTMPPLTEERRKDFAKLAKKMAEDNKVAIRNERRDAIEHIKAEEKKKTISEDDSKRSQKDIQDLTDQFVKKMDDLLASKEKEIFEV